MSFETGKNARDVKLKKSTRQSGGFSIVEALVSAVVLSASVMIISAICTRCLGSVRSDALYEIGWDIAERQLSVVDAMGVAEFLEMGMNEGTFNEQGNDFSWDVNVEETELDTLYRVAVSVSWQDRGRSRNVDLVSRLCDDDGGSL